MRKPGTWKASMRFTSNLIWRTDAWFPELKTHLQVLICSVQHTLCSTWSAHLTIPFFEYKPDCLDEHPNNMKTNNKKGSTSLIDTFYWINAWTKQSSRLQHWKIEITDLKARGFQQFCHSPRWYWWMHHHCNGYGWSSTAYHFSAQISSPYHKH